MASVVRIEETTINDVQVFILRLEAFPNGQGGFENKLNQIFVKDFLQALDEVEKRAKGGPAALVTVGKGKHYSDGLALSEVSSLGKQVMFDFLKSVELLFLRLLTFPMPTVAAVNGHAFAGEINFIDSL